VTIDPGSFVDNLQECKRGFGQLEDLLLAIDASGKPLRYLTVLGSPIAGVVFDLNGIEASPFAPLDPVSRSVLAIRHGEA
jgi:hypothetical protein